MCYAIPGKIKSIDGKFVSVEYFGEVKKARNEFFMVEVGEYVYAQGGFIVKKVTQKEAMPILDAWEEVFLKLKETDLLLAKKPKTLYQIANAKRQQVLDNSCCVHGIVEFSNYCTKDCLYCGIRKSNKNIKRYRMNEKEIISACDNAVNKLGFKALVLQSGEDDFYTDDKLESILKEARKVCQSLFILSIGERDFKTYKKLYDLGARGVLLRFETGREDLYKKLKPGSLLKDRLKLLRELKALGYLLFTGFLIGLPGESESDIVNNIRLTGDLGTEMFSFGPFIPHPDTPLGNEKAPGLKEVLDAIARSRIFYPESKIVVTTALETLDFKLGAKAGLMAGANSMMVNVTPYEYSRHYEIYPKRANIDFGLEKRIKQVLDLLYSLGRAPTDIGL